MWAIGLGESSTKKNLAAAGIAERHAMITLAHQDHPELSMVELCDLHGVSRSWYYEQLSHCEQNAEDIA